MQGLVAYKPPAYKPTPTPPSKPLCQAIYLLPGQTDSPHLHQHIDKNLLNFTFYKSQTTNALEPWRVEGWNSRGLVILASSAGGEGLGRIWEVSMSTSNNIGSFDMELPYYYHYYYYHYYYYYYYFNWNSLHARLNSHYEAWNYKKKSTKKITGYRQSV